MPGRLVQRESTRFVIFLAQRDRRLNHTLQCRVFLPNAINNLHLSMLGYEPPTLKSLNYQEETLPLSLLTTDHFEIVICALTTYTKGQSYKNLKPCEKFTSSS